VSILGLADLAPGSTVRAAFHHEDGSEDVASTRHTMNEDQIAWFKAGSALNLLRQGA
jgi:aconitate hydratase